ncbi:MAG: DEAD/DEAH box helicase [Candidatus Aenigmarchaeota archaeon]|nr:DEAD/DEAH box helicase [Candidatus Aenigmarchaeota archaeon]
MIDMKFEEMNIDTRMLELIHKLGITEPTEIQEKSIPPGMAGKDVIGQSMTGSGKTLAFSVPILHGVQREGGVQALILVPTRELANQVADFMHSVSFGGIKVCRVFGGVSIEPQISHLRRAEVVVGTPGRILDHMERRTIDLHGVKYFVLDEADRMLDMGFIDDIRRIMSGLPKQRQTMLFSATIPDEIMFIIRNFMKEPVKLKAQIFVPKHKLKQYYYNVRDEEKMSLLVHLVKKEKPSRAIVFAGTKRMADILAGVLKENDVDAEAIHGDMPQARRMKVMESFHQGRPHVLVATDVASRGLDIKDVTHIFNFDVPNDPDSYTHRIGRTARMEAEGKAITLLAVRDHELFRRILRQVKDIEKAEEHDYPKIKVNIRSHDTRGPRRGGGFGGRKRSFGRRY